MILTKTGSRAQRQGLRILATRPAESLGIVVVGLTMLVIFSMRLSGWGGPAMCSKTGI